MATSPITLDDLRNRARAMGVEMSDGRLGDILPMMQAIERSADELAALDLEGYGQANINVVPGAEDDH